MARSLETRISKLEQVTRPPDVEPFYVFATTEAGLPAAIAAAEIAAAGRPIVGVHWLEGEQPEQTPPHPDRGAKETEQRFWIGDAYRPGAPALIADALAEPHGKGPGGQPTSSLAM